MKFLTKLFYVLDFISSLAICVGCFVTIWIGLSVGVKIALTGAVCSFILTADLIDDKFHD